tara:strand:+ start:5824 stop:6180 length:357 start_codon:yes stop_codon:yes gene_type:complete
VARTALSGLFAPVPFRIILQQRARILFVQDGCPQPCHGTFALGQPFGHAKRLVDPDDFLQYASGIVAKCDTHVLSSAAHRIPSFVSRHTNRSKSRYGTPRQTAARPTPDPVFLRKFHL